jgi:hypothetical protein
MAIYFSVDQHNLKLIYGNLLQDKESDHIKLEVQ